MGYFKGLLTGAVIGAVGALLLTPKRGDEWRATFKDRTDKAKDHASNIGSTVGAAATDVKEQGAEILGTVVEKGGAIKDDVSVNLEHVKATVTQAAEDIKSEVSQAAADAKKDAYTATEIAKDAAATVKDGASTVKEAATNLKETAQEKADEVKLQAHLAAMEVQNRSSEEV